jgi:sn-glycerol 3-phosphate transport system substrate-binding protein
MKGGYFMDLFQRMNGALDFIESNITEEIDFEKISRIACCSANHFQRMFSYITGISLSEYIRRRRFTRLHKETKGRVDVYGLILPGGWNDWIFEAFVRQNGSQLMSDDGTTPMFNTPEALEALKLWVYLTQDLKVNPPLRPWNMTPDDFIARKAAMMYYTTGGMTKIRQAAKFDFGVAFMPKHKQFGTPVGGGDFHIFKRIPKVRRKAAWKFIKFMTDPKRAAYWSIQSGYVAVNKKAYETPELKQYLKDFPQAAVARDQLEYAYPKMAAVNYQRIRKAFVAILDSVRKGRRVPRKLCKKFKDKRKRY